MQIHLTRSEGNRAAAELYAARGFSVFGREPCALIVDGVPVAKLQVAPILDDTAAPRYPPPMEPGLRRPTPSNSIAAGAACRRTSRRSPR